MKIKKIQRQSELTNEQWKRVCDSAQRQLYKSTGKRFDIGIGRKFSEGDYRGWQIALVIVCKPRKLALSRVPKSRQIPERLEIRLRQKSGKYQLLSLRTDVISFRDLVPTSFRVKSRRRTAATGYLIRWTKNRRRNWGFLSVAHLFDSTSARTGKVILSSSMTLKVKVGKRASKRSNSDGVILVPTGTLAEVERDLIASKLISSTNPAEIKPLRVRSVVSPSTSRRKGKTFFPGGNAKFRFEKVFPNGLTLGERSLDDCVSVVSSDDDTYEDGTSGSYWEFGSKPACMQVGAISPSFREGIGQPTNLLMQWARRAVGASAKIVAVIE